MIVVIAAATIAAVVSVMCGVIVIHPTTPKQYRMWFAVATIVLLVLSYLLLQAARSLS